MSRYERWNTLLELLAKEGRLSVEQAAEGLAVSAAIIRRDFDELARHSSKVGARAFARICRMDEIDVLVTDTGVPPASAAAFIEAGVGIVRV